jgi:hypothetical protein
MSNTLLLFIVLGFRVVLFVLFVFVTCLVYPLQPVSLDCPFCVLSRLFSSSVLCIQCSHFTGIAELRLRNNDIAFEELSPLVGDLTTADAILLGAK